MVVDIVRKSCLEEFRRIWIERGIIGLEIRKIRRKLIWSILIEGLGKK